jgi:hypothetical protein
MRRVHRTRRSFLQLIGFLNLLLLQYNRQLEKEGHAETGIQRERAMTNVLKNHGFDSHRRLRHSLLCILR